MGRSPAFQAKRIYDPVSPADGLRVLIDRLWPRGISKDKAAIDLWLKDVTPSTGLRQWFHSEPDGWMEFARRYRMELEQQPAAIRRLIDAAQAGPVTLVSAVKDMERSHVSVLLALLQAASLLKK